MKCRGISSPYGGELFNTLAQSGTRKTTPSIKKPVIVVKGTGTELKKEAIGKRAKKKTITQPLMLKLINVAKNKGRDKKHIKAYWNTWHCQSKIHSFEGRIYGNYSRTAFALYAAEYVKPKS